MYTRIFDSGHSWLKVSKEEMSAIGFLGKTTACSFEDDDFVYLEEDCDLTTFVKMKEQRREPVEWIEDTTLEGFFNSAEVRPVAIDPQNSDCDFCGRCRSG